MKFQKNCFGMAYNNLCISFTKSSLRFESKSFLMSACIRQTAASHPKFAFTPTFIFCSPICSYKCGVVFFVKVYFSFREMIFFVRPLKYANFHREYYPSCVTSRKEYTRPTVFLST